MSTQKELVMNARLCWDSRNKKQVEEAKKWFVSFKRKGVPIRDVKGNTVQYFRPHYEELVALASQENLAGKRLLKSLCEKGDERVVWDANNGRQALEAKEKFRSLIDKGYSAYSVDAEGCKNRRIQEFDVESEEILMIPPTAKG
jgi:hypothetical protein